MALQSEVSAYLARWSAVEAVQRQERMNAPMELRWRQLNAAFAIAKGLGMIKPDESETGVIERWAKIKEKALNQQTKA